MVIYDLDALHSILYVRPVSALQGHDFVDLAKSVDPHIEATGSLAGLIIEISGFPGWEDLAAMTAHFRFVRDHHRRIKKIAILTDSLLGSLAERLASHFVSADIRRFPARANDAARQWILAVS